MAIIMSLYEKVIKEELKNILPKNQINNIHEYKLYLHIAHLRILSKIQGFINATLIIGMVITWLMMN